VVQYVAIILCIFFRYKFASVSGVTKGLRQGGKA